MTHSMLTNLLQKVYKFARGPAYVGVRGLFLIKKIVPLVSLLILSCGQTYEIISPVPGPSGLPGAVGPQGLPGAPAPSPSPTPTPYSVKFCSNSSKANTFPEYGICINSQLFAVYWDGKNAWLTEVPPGTYLSTSTSTPCDFEVQSNCVVKER